MKERIKSAIKDLLCNDFTGSLIIWIFGYSIPDIRWKGYRFQLPRKGVTKTNIASILWGFYESAEIRLIQKYLDPTLDVVEMGGSLGIVSGHIASKLNADRKMISVEANPFLLENIRTNMARFAKPGLDYEAWNFAVQYHEEEVAVHISADNTESGVGRKSVQTKESILARTITLKEIIQRKQIGEYALVCDIEGSEIEIVLYDLSSLNHCRQLFIELHEVDHNGRHYTPDDILNMLLDGNGFELVAREGPVCYLKK
jgi:FkbM family methyltransferase